MRAFGYYFFRFLGVTWDLFQTTFQTVLKTACSLAMAVKHVLVAHRNRPYGCQLSFERGLLGFQMTDKIYFNHVKWHMTISIGFIGLRGLCTILFPVQIAQLLHNSSTNLGYLSKLQIRQTWYKSLYFIFLTKNIPFNDQNSETLHNAFNVGLASFSFVSGIRLFNIHLLTNRISSLRF